MPSTKLPNLELFSEGHHLYEIKGMGTPSIDNFASFRGKKLSMICSLVEYVNTINVEALAINWTGKYASVTQTSCYPLMLKLLINRNSRKITSISRPAYSQNRIFITILKCQILW